jgi:predicted nucleotide-binding protein
MDPSEIQKQKLVGDINAGLEQTNGSLVPVLRKAIRLAKLCNDLEHQFLFELHLDGASIIGGVRVEKWPDQNVKPKWDFLKAFAEDRMSDSGQIQGLSIEQLETMIADMGQVRSRAIAKGAPQGNIIELQFELQSILTRIRNRVGNFVLQIEHSLSDNVDRTQVHDAVTPTSQRKAVFIGHGRSNLWRDLKDFFADRLRVPWDEFNRESTAGKSNKERLEEMLNNASFAFLVMTAEDEHSDKTMHARENVIHEIGLFQGRLGFSKAIILLEEPCTEFSNIHGLTQIRFPNGDILAKSEEIRRVLEREGILAT